MARGLGKAGSSNKWDDSRRTQRWFRVPDSQLCRTITESLWCFSKLFFLKFVLVVTNNQLRATSCNFLFVFYMVKSVSSSVFLSAPMWAYIAPFNCSFIGTSFRTSFHYPVVWHTSELLLFLSLLCRAKMFSSTLFLIIIPYKSRVNILLHWQRVFHLDDGKDTYMYMSLYSLNSCLLQQEVNRQLTNLHAQPVVLIELRSVFSDFWMYTNLTHTGNFTSHAILHHLLRGKKI